SVRVPVSAQARQSVLPACRSPPGPLPLKPPLKPQLARSRAELPEGDGWRYEPQWDGLRTIVVRAGDDVHLQSRNGRPMNRYFPEIEEQVRELPGERLVLDGEM